jgi:hypothetical protein
VYTFEEKTKTKKNEREREKQDVHEKLAYRIVGAKVL